MVGSLVTYLKKCAASVLGAPYTLLCRLLPRITADLRYGSGYRALFEHAIDGIFIMDAEGHYLDVNPAICSAIGYTRDEFLALDWGVLSRGVDSGWAAASLARIVGGEPLREERTVWTRNGDQLTVELSAHLLPDGKILGIARDVSERKRMEESLRSTSEFLDTILDEAPLPIYITSVDGTLRLANNAWERETGIPRNAAVGRRLNELFPAAMCDQFSEINRRVVESNATAVQDEFLDFGAGVRVFHTIKFPLRDAAGGVVDVGGISIDITDRSKMEGELRAAHAAAVDSSRAKIDFLANMSHEIRTPMNGVIGTLELLRETDLDPRQREYAEIARESAESMLAVINMVLDYSKIESHQLVLEAVPFAIREAVERAVKPFRAVAARKGVMVAADVPPHVPETVVGDPVRFSQIVANLVGNAVKFTEQGAITVQLGAAAVDDCRIDVSCSVGDTGAGISPEKFDTIFDPFVQADGSTTRIHGGTGLGLAIVRRLVEAMDGVISVASEPGMGSTFSFRVRLRGAPDDIASPPPATGWAVAEKSVAVRPLSVLLVDDSAVSRKVVSLLLESDGHRVTFAGDGVEALAAIGREAFDLVLMDVQMPVMDGFEAMRAIRAGEAAGGARLPIIALTARALAGDRELCLEAGADDYLAKPVNFSELRRVISRHCCRESKPSALSAENRPDAAGATPPAGMFGELMDELGASVGDRDEDAVERCTRMLKRAASHLGRTRLVDEIFRLQLASRRGDWERADELLGVVAVLLPTTVGACGPPEA
ncbi:PAS domain-containing protein [Geobacter sulfurreducens]|uniref:PAS domain-containing protein n=1 Tax=Geobacter sulfurreducens TaxID=35554 RepID=UPI0001D8F1A3|nr:PAS domain-containing protein [Geobacter sulfurreducens]ADI84120.1 sensor histidine kinase response regulator, PAS and PAS domain-containing [Geobacter sulfurreducens KN400]